MWLLWLLLLSQALVLRFSYAQTYTISTVSSPGSSCTAGEICLISPTVELLDSSGARATAVTGYTMYVKMYESPTGFEPLIIGDPSIGGCDVAGFCGTTVTSPPAGTPAPFSFVNGLATASNLLIKTVGQDYRLIFFARGPDFVDFSTSISDVFDVFLGAEYKLLFTRFVGKLFFLLYMIR
jgi:hypothetical protein